MKVKLSFSNGDSQIVNIDEAAAWIEGRTSFNDELITPIKLIKIEELPSVQERFNQWIQETGKLDISTKEGLHAVNNAFTELNRITLDAGKSIEW